MHWFFLKNDPAAPLPVFSEHLVEEVPPSWPWGTPVKEKKRMRDVLEAIAFLKTRGLLDVLRDLTVVEQPLGEHCPDKLRVGRHPVQQEDARQ